MPDTGANSTLYDTFSLWKGRYNLNYSAEMEHIRYLIWLKTESAIDDLNAADSNAVFSHNAFSALSDDEKQRLCGVLLGSVNNISTPANSTYRRRLSTLPLYVDWQSSKNVGPVKNQEACSSCYVFAAVAQIESAISIASGQAVVPLSEEYALDCSRVSGGVEGCSGGLPLLVMQTMQSTYGGIIPETLDEYTAGLTQPQGQCPSQYLQVTATSPPGTAVWQTQAGASSLCFLG